MSERSTVNMKCPRCKRKPHKIEELWSGIGQTYSLDEFGNVKMSLIGNMSGNMVYYATCSNCEHTWKLKGKNKIKEIEHWEDNKKYDKAGWCYMDKKDMLHKPKTH